MNYSYGIILTRLTLPTEELNQRQEHILRIFSAFFQRPMSCFLQKLQSRPESLLISFGYFSPSQYPTDIIGYVLKASPSSVKPLNILRIFLTSFSRLSSFSRSSAFLSHRSFQLLLNQPFSCILQSLKLLQSVVKLQRCFHYPSATS